MRIRCFTVFNKRLIYGTSSAFESSQKQIEITISGYPKAKNISDDIVVWGNTLEEQNENLKTLLQRKWFENKSQKMQICCHQNYIQW